MENIDNNTYADGDDTEEHEFKYNFVDTPWDDRSKRSKAGIVLVLLSILLATIACVANSFCMHYRGFKTTANVLVSEFNCQLVKMDDYRFAVRIQSVQTQDLICVGALISDTAVLASGACVKSGTVRLYVGNPNDRTCKKGFAVEDIEPIYHDGIISKKLVLIYATHSMARCADPVRIGAKIRNNSRAHIIGRTMLVAKSLSRQPVTINLNEDCVCEGINKKGVVDKGYIICVRGMARCPVMAGDLLLQDGMLFGLSSTTVRGKEHGRLACFADLKPIHKTLEATGIHPKEPSSKGVHD